MIYLMDGYSHRVFLSKSSGHGEEVITLALLASLYTLPRKEAKRFELGGVNKTAQRVPVSRPLHIPPGARESAQVCA
jgi:hypothetical protein